VTPADKKKLQDAIRASLDKDPNADKFVPGAVDMDGNKYTLRQLTEIMLKDEAFYQQIDMMLAASGQTIDQVIARITKSAAPSAPPTDLPAQPLPKKPKRPRGPGIGS
jgi:hypothetical protein